MSSKCEATGEEEGNWRISSVRNSYNLGLEQNNRKRNRDSPGSEHNNIKRIQLEKCMQFIADIIIADLANNPAAVDKPEREEESLQNVNDEQEGLEQNAPHEFMCLDFGPEETGTRPSYTGHEPWAGACVLVIGSYFKGSTGTLRHVQIDWSLLDTIIDMTPGVDLSQVKSGLLLDVELDIVRATHGASAIERIDYRDVVELRTLQRLNVWRPLHHYHEVWYLRPDLPDPIIRNGPFPIARLSMFDSLQIDVLRTPRPRTPTPPPRSPRFVQNLSDPWNPLAILPPTEADHWILHPKLTGLEIEVEIIGGPYDSGGYPVHVTPVLKSQGIVVEYTTGRGSTMGTHSIAHKFIAQSSEDIKAGTETALMAVIAGEHAGKLVRRIRKFYLGERNRENLWIVGGVILPGKEEKLTNERLDISPQDLVRVRESPEQRAKAKKYMSDARDNAATEWGRRPEV
ncbi:hypothetical protein AAF712_016189 [Marasmius tenuissimus]|uniref:Uncharacterized protein n=1 Tax=Marasmius tenuissimus TaxID=585030 RepID=A0ABR2Z8F4_9AGAR